jgi:putative FmdB family regulatory protein
MPIYEYRCEHCEHELEVIQKISDAALKDCPACGEPALKKKISAAAFRLKGSGWYETDFKNSDRKKNLAQQETNSSDAKPADKKDAVKEKSTDKGGSSDAAGSTATS